MTPLRALAAFIALAMASAMPALADFNDQPPEAKGQVPAFENQTRAPVIPRALRMMRDTLTDGLANPWGMALLPDGSLLITEREGRMRLFRDGQLSEPLKGLPEIVAGGQGGLMDVVVAQDFAQTRQVWFSFTEPHENYENSTSVGTGTLSADGSALEDVQVIFQQNPPIASSKHFGSRLVFDPEGMLYVTVGDRGMSWAESPGPQDLGDHLGKVMRIDPQTGAAAPGNPFVDQVGAQPEIWSYGHRNIQSAALDPQGRLWTVEHGPNGGDELNRPQAGLNYGWPIISYGEDYGEDPVNGGITAQEGMEQPVYYWDPVIAPSGMVFYQGEMFPEWQGDVLIGGLRSNNIVRLKLDGDKVVGEQRFAEWVGRVRDLEVDQDGALLLLTDDDPGALIKFSRVGARP